MNYYVDFAASFINRSQKTATAVRLRFDIFNVFDEHLRTVYGTDSAQAETPGEQQDDIAIDQVDENVLRSTGQNPPQIFLPTWEFININDTTAKVVCSPDTVMFSDGAQWRAPEPTDHQLEAALKYARSVQGFFSKPQSDDGD